MKEFIDEKLYSFNKKYFVQQFFDSVDGHFTHVLCRRTGSINVFLYAIGVRGVGRIRHGFANP